MMIQRDRSLIEEGVGAELLLGVLREYAPERRRMLELWDYYAGEHAILRRRRTAQTANNRLVVNHPAYISDMAASYLIGCPVRYGIQPETGDGGAGDAGWAGELAVVTRALALANADTVDAELAKQASIFGRGIETLYADEDGMPRCAALDPRSAFVVYEESVQRQPLFGVQVLARRDAEGRTRQLWVEAVTARGRQRFVAEGDAYDLRGPGGGWLFKKLREVPLEEREAVHYFGGVPMVEYANNQDRRGDFEPVLSLVDAYNLLQSDRVNDKEQLVDAVLLILGEFLGDSEAEFQQAVKRLSEHRILEMGAGSDARFLTKGLNEGQVQVLADALVTDIHKISMVPALTDQHFASESSGVAMKYKLLGFDQLIKRKERFFREGLRRRLRLFTAFLAKQQQALLDPDRVTMTFDRDLPVNELEQAQTLAALAGVLPQEELAGLARERLLGEAMATPQG